MQFITQKDEYIMRGLTQLGIGPGGYTISGAAWGQAPATELNMAAVLSPRH
jgi:hypothetical protein